MNYELFPRLARLHILTPAGLCRLIKSIASDGITLMALLRFAAHYYPDRCALVADRERLTYREFHGLACRLAAMMHHGYGLKADMCVGLLCRNHIMTVLLLPALSRLGVKIKLINTDIAPGKVHDMVKKTGMQLLICDTEYRDALGTLPCRSVTTDALRNALQDCKDDKKSVPHICRGREISVFTGGSSGNYKEAPQRMSVFQFLPPLFALLQDIHIDERNSVFIPLPLFHGFGLAALIVSLVMGKKVCLMGKFNADEALRLIEKEKTEVLSLVPAMLARLWQTDGAHESMRCVKCIICGGDRLDRKWIEMTDRQLGRVLYNLYGTSEAGFFMIASPEALMTYEEVTIGKPIRGVKCKVENTDADGTGALWVSSGWAMTGMKKRWQNTGDLVFRNAQGYYFYRGRADRMVVCGGENVYSNHVERVINEHPEVMASKVFPVPHPSFGTVLNAKVELIPSSTLSSEEISSWLRERLSRAEMPHEIAIGPLKMLETGKHAY